MVLSTWLKLGQIITKKKYKYIIIIIDKNNKDLLDFIISISTNKATFVEATHKYDKLHFWTKSLGCIVLQLQIFLYHLVF